MTHQISQKAIDNLIMELIKPEYVDPFSKTDKSGMHVSSDLTSQPRPPYITQTGDEVVDVFQGEFAVTRAYRATIRFFLDG